MTAGFKTFSILLALLLAAACAGSQEQYQGPHISFETTDYDLGPIPQNGKFEFSFRYTNNGTEPLQILSLASSCGCAVMDKVPPPLQPGESGTVDGSFFSGEYKDKVVRTVTVKTSDPQNNTVILTINAFVKESSVSK